MSAADFLSFRRANEVVLHYRDAGPRDAPVLVFGNSLGTDFRIWNRVAAAFQENWRVILHDKRGHGLSDTPAGPYSLADHANDLLALLDGLGVRRFTMVGLSVGGMIAQHLAAQVPERMERLVLCDTADRIGTAETWNARIAAVREHGLGSIADAVLERWFTPTFRMGRAVELAGWRHMLARMPAEGYAATCAAIRDADLTGAAGAISCPTLLVAGDQDLSTPPDLVRATAERIPGSRFEIIAGCGHIPCVEQPEMLIALIASHVNEVAHV